MTEIYIRNLTKKQQEICKACKAKGGGISPVCKLAVAECVVLKRLIKPSDVSNRGINPSEIHIDCPNLYGNLIGQFAQTYE
jgi:hypothetical protein